LGARAQREAAVGGRESGTRKPGGEGGWRGVLAASLALLVLAAQGGLEDGEEVAAAGVEERVAVLERALERADLRPRGGLVGGGEGGWRWVSGGAKAEGRSGLAEGSELWPKRRKSRKVLRSGRETGGMRRRRAAWMKSVCLRSWCCARKTAAESG